MDPESQELRLRRAGVPWENLFRDVGVSGSTGTQERRGWHRLNARLAGGDTLVVVAIDRIGRTWQDTVRSICELLDRGVKIRSWSPSSAGPGMGWSGPASRGRPSDRLGRSAPGSWRRMREGGASLRRIASDFECSPSTVLRALRREGVGA